MVGFIGRDVDVSLGDDGGCQFEDTPQGFTGAAGRVNPVAGPPSAHRVSVRSAALGSVHPGASAFRSAVSRVSMIRRLSAASGARCSEA